MKDTYSFPLNLPWHVYATILCIIGPIVFGVWGLRHCNAMGPSKLKSFQDEVININSSGTLIFSASIYDATANKFLVDIDLKRSQIKRLVLNSNGGQEGSAERMTVGIQSLENVPIEVPDGAICFSACIQLISHPPGPLVIAPTARLMFHAKATRVGLASCGPCGLLNKVTVWVSLRLPVFLYNQRFMEAWTRELSPRLIDLFSLCKIDPLTTEEGLTLTGSEFTALKDEHFPLTSLKDKCPAQK